MEKEYIKCAMCHQDIQPNEIGWIYGKSGEPLVDGRVCDNCHPYVLEQRLKQSLMGGQK